MTPRYVWICRGCYWVLRLNRDDAAAWLGLEGEDARCRRCSDRMEPADTDRRAS